jgi:biopolymer transport protein TolR
MASSSNGNDGQITGINVTPLVDIMLVLLIIFMVTATYVVKESIEIELPKAAAGGETTARTLALVVTKDGKAFLDGQEVTEAALVEKIASSPDKREDMQAIIGADKGAMHGDVVHYLDVLREQGITKFAIQVERQDPVAAR